MHRLEVRGKTLGIRERLVSSPYALTFSYCGVRVHNLRILSAQTGVSYPAAGHILGEVCTTIALLPRFVHRFSTALSTAKINLLPLLFARLCPLSTAPIKTTTKYILSY